MADRVRIELVPLGESFEVERGTPLESVLYRYGVEFPCGGAGQCRGCRVRVVSGEIPVTREMEDLFTEEELRQGWRLACRAEASGPLVLEVAQWEARILSDESHLEAEPADGLGIAIDIGTTTVVAQLLDLRTGAVLAVQSALNPQAPFGADVMSRVEAALRGADLTSTIRSGLMRMISALDGAKGDVREVVLAGNTVMHHLFCGIGVEPLSRVPFETPAPEERIFRPSELDWALPDDCAVRFLPCIGGFVGSDILAGLLAAGMMESDNLHALIDLGTNGEIVVGNRRRMLCASTAAGPAFEAGRISMGMRASTGAIAHVEARDGAVRCTVLGEGEARGICGSGLVDAVAAGLELGRVTESGRLAGGQASLPLCGAVALTQRDIRELQLAKGAVAAGWRILLERLGAQPGDVATLHLAGAFGNYVNIGSARRIGLLDIPAARVHSSGNTALRGAKAVLLAPRRSGALMRDALAILEHVPLGADARFQETFVECMAFPPYGQAD